MIAPSSKKPASGPRMVGAEDTIPNVTPDRRHQAVRYFPVDFHAEQLFRLAMVAPARRPGPSRPASASLDQWLFGRLRSPAAKRPQRTRLIIFVRRKGI